MARINTIFIAAKVRNMKMESSICRGRPRKTLIEEVTDALRLHNTTLCQIIQRTLCLPQSSPRCKTSSIGGKKNTIDGEPCGSSSAKTYSFHVDPLCIHVMNSNQDALLNLYSYMRLFTPPHSSIYLRGLSTKYSQMMERFISYSNFHQTSQHFLIRRSFSPPTLAVINPNS